MKKSQTNSIREANEQRRNLRKAIISIGTPIAAILAIGAGFALVSILSTFAAEKDFKEVENSRELSRVIEKINRTAYTSAFVEGYKANYNYATAIAPLRPENAINIYASVVVPMSPPEFICYPTMNGYYYSIQAGDRAMERGSFMEAETFYNYADYFIDLAPDCFTGGGGGGDTGEGGSGGEGEPQDQSDQSEGDDESQTEPNESDKVEELKEDIEERREQARQAQGKEKQDNNSESEKPSQEQLDQNSERSEKSQQDQRQTQDERNSILDGDTPSDSIPPEKPW